MRNRSGCSVCAAQLLPERRHDVCPQCLPGLRQAILNLPKAYVYLHVELRDAVSRWKAHRAPRRIPVPDRIAVHDRVPAHDMEPLPQVSIPLLGLVQQSREVIRSWTTEAVPHMIPRRPMRPGRLLRIMCEGLASDLDTALDSRSAGTYACAVVGLYHCARQLLGWSAPVMRLSAPCPRCDWRALHISDDRHISCHRCAGYWTGEAWQLSRPGRAAR